MEQWSEKVAIVTGASSGIGEAIARALAGHGIHVVALARREDRLRQLADSVKSSGGSIHPIRCDLRKEANILEAFQYTESKFGGVDILVNNAGISLVESISGGKTETYRAILEVNVLAPAIATREAVRSMRKRGTRGHIINMNSIFGRSTPPTPEPISLYPASKFALDAMTANLRQEITANKDNIKVTGIHPGLVKTDIVALSGADAEKVFKSWPYIQPEDVANSIVFVLSAPGNVQVDDLTIKALHS